MKVINTDLDGVVIVEPDVYGDQRGFFMETYNRERYKIHGIDIEFVQDNYSFSTKGILRGLHYQYEHTQAKLVQVLDGEVFDVAVDVREGSPNFGKWTGVYLSGENKRQLFIPEGFAHGFYVISETAMFVYKCSDYYSPEKEYGVLWSDPYLNIKWPGSPPVLSEKDKSNDCLRNIPKNRLPVYKKG